MVESWGDPAVGLCYTHTHTHTHIRIRTRTRMRQRERERERERERDRERETERQRQRQRQRDSVRTAEPASLRDFRSHVVAQPEPSELVLLMQLVTSPPTATGSERGTVSHTGRETDRDRDRQTETEKGGGGGGREGEKGGREQATHSVSSSEVCGSGWCR